MDTAIFATADLEGTPLAESAKEGDPAEAARAGYEALMRGDREVVSGFSAKLVAALSGVLPESLLAGLHRRQAGG